MTESSDLIVEASLSAHAVLTISKGPFLVSGREAHNFFDPVIKSQLFSKFCSGIRHEILRKGLETMGPDITLNAVISNKNMRTEAIRKLKSMSARIFNKKSKSNRGRSTVLREPKRLNNLEGV